MTQKISVEAPKVQSSQLVNYKYLRYMNIPAVIRVFENVRHLPEYRLIAPEIIAHLRLVKEEKFSDFKVQHDPPSYEHNIFLLYFDQIVEDVKQIRRWAMQLYDLSDIRYKEFKIFCVLRSAKFGRLNENILYSTKSGVLTKKPFIDPAEMSQLLRMSHLTRRELQEGGYIFLESDRRKAELLESCLRAIHGATSQALAAIKIDLPAVGQQLGGFSLSADQIKALNLINTGSVSIITGHAGTGKTTVIRYIWDWYRRKGQLDKLYLLTPTTMAAENIRERNSQILCEGQGDCFIDTIHRLVADINKRRCEFPSGSLIVFDESSMLDNILVELIAKDRQNLHNNKFVFVGDDAQLRPVARDSLFRMILGILPTRTVHLYTNFRSQDLIISNANLILNAYDFYLLEGTNYVIDSYSRVREIDYGRYLRGVEGSIMTNFMFITYRNDDVILINHLVRDLFMAEVYSSESIEAGLHLTAFSRRFPLYKKAVVTGHWEWRVGDRARSFETIKGQISNGSIAFVTGFSGENIILDYKGKTVCLHHRYLWPAYCITVHGSQGQEWPYVAFCEFSGEPLSRELFYVGATRAKQKMFILRVIKGSDSTDSAKNWEKSRFQVTNDTDLLEIFVEEY